MAGCLKDHAVPDDLPSAVIMVMMTNVVAAVLTQMKHWHRSILALSFPNGLDQRSPAAALDARGRLVQRMLAGLQFLKLNRISCVATNTTWFIRRIGFIFAATVSRNRSGCLSRSTNTPYS